VGVEVSIPVLHQFPLQMPCNASVFADVVSVVYVEYGNHFTNGSIVFAVTTLTINSVKPTTVLVCL